MASSDFPVPVGPAMMINGLRPPGPRGVRLLVLGVQDTAQMSAAVNRAGYDWRATYCTPVLDDDPGRLLEHAQDNAHCDQDDAAAERLLHHRRRPELRDRRSRERLVDHIEREHDVQ